MQPADIRLTDTERTWLGAGVDTPDGPGSVVGLALVVAAWVSDGTRCWRTQLDDLRRRRINLTSTPNPQPSKENP